MKVLASIHTPQNESRETPDPELLRPLLWNAKRSHDRRKKDGIYNHR